MHLHRLRLHLERRKEIFTAQLPEIRRHLRVTRPSHGATGGGHFVMNTPALRITLVSETFPPEINGVANTLGRLSEGCASAAIRWRWFAHARPARHRCTRPNLMLCRGWACRATPACSGASVDAQAVAPLAPAAPGRAVHRHRRAAGLSALRAARRLGMAVVSGFHTNFPQYSGQYGLGLLTPAHPLPALVPSAHRHHPGAQRQPAPGTGTPRVRAPGLMARGSMPACSTRPGAAGVARKLGLAR
jgi:hypothetical protein